MRGRRNRSLSFGQPERDSKKRKRGENNRARPGNSHLARTGCICHLSIRFGASEKEGKGKGGEGEKKKSFLRCDPPLFSSAVLLARSREEEGKKKKN